MWRIRWIRWLFCCQPRVVDDKVLHSDWRAVPLLRQVRHLLRAGHRRPRDGVWIAWRRRDGRRARQHHRRQSAWRRIHPADSVASRIWGGWYDLQPHRRSDSRPAHGVWRINSSQAPSALGETNSEWLVNETLELTTSPVTHQSIIWKSINARSKSSMAGLAMKANIVKVKVKRNCDAKWSAVPIAFESRLFVQDLWPKAKVRESFKDCI